MDSSGAGQERLEVNGPSPCSGYKQAVVVVDDDALLVHREHKY